MAPKITLLVAASLMLIATTASAGWDEWSTAQRDAVTGFIATNDTVVSFSGMLDLMNERPVTSVTTNMVEVPREPNVAFAERVVIALAQEYDLDRTMTNGEKDQVFIDAFVSAPNTNQKIKVGSDRSLFWAAYMTAGNLDGTGSDTSEYPQIVRTYGESFATINNLGEITPKDLRKALAAMSG